MPRRAAATPAAAFVVLSDERLADLARAGNDKAFAAIFRRHHQALYRYCRGLLRSDHDAQDALQNTFVQALRALPNESRKIALKPWLYKVAHNEAISIIRSRRTTSELDEAADVASHAASEHADHREQLRELLSDLDELAERQRAALLMRELGGLGVGEIASALDTTTQAASQAIYDARKALNEFALGRAMRCSDVEVAVSARDGRRLKSRPLRAHLRRCESCQAFQVSITTRRATFAELAPEMPAAVAGSILAGMVGTGAAGAGVAAGLTATSVTVKITALAAAAGLVGTGGYVALTEHPQFGDPPASTSVGNAPRNAARSAPVPSPQAAAPGAGAAASAPGLTALGGTSASGAMSQPGSAPGCARAGGRLGRLEPARGVRHRHQGRHQLRRRRDRRVRVGRRRRTGGAAGAAAADAARRGRHPAQRASRPDRAGAAGAGAARGRSQAQHAQQRARAGDRQRFRQRRRPVRQRRQEQAARRRAWWRPRRDAQRR